MVSEYDNIIKSIDFIGCDYYSHERQKLLCKGIDIARKENNKEKEKEMFYEFALLNNTLGGQVTKEGVKQISDKWKWAYDNLGEPLKNSHFCEWELKAIPYYLKRIKESKNNLNKAWYNYIIWTLSKGKPDSYKYALQSSELFLLATNDYLTDKKYCKYYNTFPFCFRIALKIAVKFKRQKLVVKIVEHLIKCANQEVSEKEIRWSLELYEILAEYSKNLTNADCKKYIKPELPKIEKIVHDYIKGNNFHLGRSFLSVLIIFVRQLSLNSETKRLSELNAETYILEAKSRKGEALVEMTFYQQALKEYANLGDAAKVKFLKEKIRESGERIQWKTASTKINIPSVEVDCFIAKICHFTPEEMADFIGRKDREFIPNVTNAMKFALELRKEHPLLSLFSTEIVADGLPLKHKNVGGSLFKYEVKKQFLLEAKMREIALGKIFEEFKDYQLSKENLVKNFEASENIPPETQKILVKALEYHFKEDFVGSIHLFIPQIESTIRHILKKKGHNVVSIKDVNDVELRERILGGLLNSDNAIKVFSTDFIMYLKTKLTDEEFDNYRNRMCHGQMEVKEFNKGLSISLVYIFLKLSKI